jgi:hypothetical protein
VLKVSNTEWFSIIYCELCNMGASISKWSDLSDSKVLCRLIGEEAVAPEDPFWNGLFSVSVRRPSTWGEWKRFDEAVHPLIVTLAKNEANSKNLWALVNVLLSRQAELLSALEDNNLLYCWQLLNGLFVLRVAAKGLVGLCQDEEQLLRVFGGQRRCEDLFRALAQNIINLEENGISYHLQLESVQLFIVLLSSPLYGRSSKMFDKLLTTMTDMAPGLSQKLLERFIKQSEGPPDLYEPGSEKAGSSLVLSLASGLWNILTFGYSSVVPSSAHNTADGSIDEEMWSTRPLADLSVLALLLLINHSSTTSITEQQPEDHCYRNALCRCFSHKDTETVSEPVARVSFSVDFSKLFHTLSQSTQTEEGTLLLYTLLHRNDAFKTFVLASSDIDWLVVPLLKTLYSANERNNNHTYMSLIILLILSEDELFNGYVHDNFVKDLDWYGERVLGEISLGGLIILVVIRTIQHNMLKMRDKYLHTNCLAALANMSSQFKNLHPYVCQRILSLFEALARRYYRIVASLKSLDNFKEEDRELSNDLAADVVALEEVLRMVLEIVNSTLISQNKSNSNFIYTLLYQQHIFEPFHNHPMFQDLLQNIITVC